MTSATGRRPPERACESDFGSGPGRGSGSCARSGSAQLQHTAKTNNSRAKQQQWTRRSREAKSTATFCERDDLAGRDADSWAAARPREGEKGRQPTTIGERRNRRSSASSLIGPARVLVVQLSPANSIHTMNPVRRLAHHSRTNIVCGAKANTRAGAMSGVVPGGTRLTIAAMTSSHGPHDNGATSDVDPKSPGDVAFVTSTPCSDLTRRSAVSDAIHQPGTDRPCRFGHESTIRSESCARSVDGAVKRVCHAFIEIVKRSRQAQGLPDHVSDPDTLRRIAQILQTRAAGVVATRR